MDIYKARQLQKILYKQSSVDFKRMRTFLLEGKLIYAVFHKLWDKGNVLSLDSGNVKRMYEDIFVYDITVIIQNITKEVCDAVPEGYYIVEIIEVD